MAMVQITELLYASVYLSFMVNSKSNPLTSTVAIWVQL